ncbi:MAG: ABC transporter permease [Actinomycetales bacterium]
MTKDSRTRPQTQEGQETPVTARSATVPRPDSGRADGPAPSYQRIAAQTRFEAATILANGEQLVLTFVLPVLALLAVVHLTWIPLPVPTGASRVDVTVPGVLAVAVVSTAFTGQAIATAFDRRHGVLRLLGTTPLGRGGLLAARFLAVLTVVLVQSLLLGGMGLALGWRPAAAGIPVAVAFIVLGCLCFLALGLLLGGTMRAEGVLAVANLVWVLLTAAGGLLLPSHATGAPSEVVRLLPSGALGDGLRSALVSGRVDATAVGVLLVWTTLSVLAARRWFRWD